MNEAPISTGRVVAYGAAALVICIGLVLGLGFGCKSYNRYQKRQDAKNQVKVNRTRIQYYQQQEGIERKKAEIRVIHAIGIRKAQDHIAKTLTPLYVAFEMTQALQAISVSGKNNSVVYLPTNPSNGLPIVPGLQPQTSTTGK